MMTFRRIRQLLKYQRHVLILILISFILGIVIGIKLLTNPASVGGSATGSILLSKLKLGSRKTYRDESLVAPVVDEQLQRDDEIDMVHNRDNDDKPEGHDDGGGGEHHELSYDVHAFYYIWYGNPEHDGKYLHWNHEYMPHWNNKLPAPWPTGFHKPPDDIGANFYPELGVYSSQDSYVIEEHMKQLRTAGIGVIAVSWYPPGHSDGQGEEIDAVIPLLLDAAQRYDIKVCIHIEPFQGRNAATMKTNLQYILMSYGKHPAYYKRRHHNKLLPLFYVYDSYNLRSEEWARLFSPSGDLSVRNTELDAIFIGLLVEMKHRRDLFDAGFDGFYTYFASNGFSYGSNTNNWRTLAQEAAGKGLLFIPSVGPGYVDDRVRPWNTVNTKERKQGEYYENYLHTAVDLNPPIISITSFNEWHEGTQIENAVPKIIKDYKYLDYRPHAPDHYLGITKEWVLKFMKQKNL